MANWILHGVNQKSSNDKNQQRIKKITNTPGIRVSYQNVYHQEPTAALWKEAKDKATDKTGHTNNLLKHQWTPEALTIFIPDYTYTKRA